MELNTSFIQSAGTGSARWRYCIAKSHVLKVIVLAKDVMGQVYSILLNTSFICDIIECFFNILFLIYEAEKTMII